MPFLMYFITLTFPALAPGFCSLAGASFVVFTKIMLVFFIFRLEKRCLGHQVFLMKGCWLCFSFQVSDVWKKWTFIIKRLIGTFSLITGRVSIWNFWIVLFKFLIFFLLQKWSISEVTIFFSFFYYILSENLLNDFLSIFFLPSFFITWTTFQPQQNNFFPDSN